MTDLHSHILPGIDDGAQLIDDMVYLLHMAQDEQISRIALTSHFRFERQNIVEFLNNRKRAWQRMQRALRHEPDLHIELQLGAEVYFSPGLCELEGLENLCIGDTDYMLIELSTSHKPHFIKETFGELRDRGITPVIAHVERYPYVQEDPTLLYDWIENGAYTQINTESLIKNNRLALNILQWIEWDLVQVIATDTHSVDKRPPRMLSAIHTMYKHLGEEKTNQILDNADRIFDNKVLYIDAPYCPHKVWGKWK